MRSSMLAVALLAGLTSCRRIPVQPSPVPPEVGAREALRADTGEASVTTDDYSGTVPPSGPVRFARASAALTIESRDLLATFAAWASTRRCRIRVAGHSDEPDLALGDRRARVVADYLVALGIDASRLDTITSASSQRSISSIARSAGAR
jgi:peptidoglycan-associated lipoprotein